MNRKLLKSAKIISVINAVICLTLGGILIANFGEEMLYVVLLAAIGGVLTITGVILSILALGKGEKALSTLIYNGIMIGILLAIFVFSIMPSIRM